MPSAKLIAKKANYFSKLIESFQTHDNVLIVHADFVGSKQMQNIRIGLRGRATVLMGKNTMIRTALRQRIEECPELGFENLADLVRGNIGFIFCKCPMDEVREFLAENKVPAAAKAGVISSCDVELPSGPTGLDPSNTNFFQALNIATKIVKGQIELVTAVKILETGKKVNLSEQVLLQKLNIMPFFYSLRVIMVWQKGAVFDVAVLDITDDILMSKWSTGVSYVAAMSREMGVPTEASLPHAIGGAFKNVAALVGELDYTFPQVETIKAFLADPSAFAVAAAPAAAAAGGAAPAAAAAVVEEEEEEEMDFDLFG